jgi:hypothetical protein
MQVIAPARAVAVVIVPKLKNEAPRERAAAEVIARVLLGAVLEQHDSPACEAFGSAVEVAVGAEEWAWSPATIRGLQAASRSSARAPTWPDRGRLRLARSRARG